MAPTHSSPPDPVVVAFRALFTAGTDHWFDADNVLETSGATESWLDQATPGSTLTQATALNRAAAPAADAAFGGAKSVAFNGTSNDYISNLPASDWDFLHGANGKAATAVSVYYLPTPVGNKVIWSTFSASGTGGAWHFPDLRYLSVRQSDNSAPAANGGAGALDVGTFSRCKFDISDSSDMRVFQKSTQVASADLTAAVYNTAPAQTLRVGNLQNAALNWFSGRLRALYFFQRALSAPDIATLHAYIQQTTGIVP